MDNYNYNNNYDYNYNNEKLNNNEFKEMGFNDYNLKKDESNYFSNISSINENNQIYSNFE